MLPHWRIVSIPWSSLIRIATLLVSCPQQKTMRSTPIVWLLFCLIDLRVLLKSMLQGLKWECFYYIMVISWFLKIAPCSWLSEISNGWILALTHFSTWCKAKWSGPCQKIWWCRFTPPRLMFRLPIPAVLLLRFLTFPSWRQRKPLF